MTQLSPFPAYVVRPEWAPRVVSQMHDALTPEERAAIMAANPDSYLHVTRRPAEASVLDEPHGAEALRRLMDADAFRSFPKPALYLYRLDSPGRSQTGVVAEVPVRAFAAGEVRGHEAVESERVAALVQHFEEVPARSDLVALMFRHDPEVSDALEACASDTPILEIERDRGVAQTVWRLADDEIAAAIAKRLDDRPLYITDGHHRVAASVEAWERSGRPEEAGVLCVLFPDAELRALAFDRRVTGPLPEGVGDRIGAQFAVEEAAVPPREPGAFGLYLEGRWLRLEPKERSRVPGAEGLDVARLHREVLAPLFGIDGLGDPRLEVASELVPTEELTRRCDGDGGALFVLRAPSIEELVEVADRGEVMAAKSTYFDPKPRSGVFVRLIEA